MSRERLEEHRRLWRRKAALREVYRVWFEALLGELPRHGVVLEVGAGPGLLSEYARDRRPGLRWVSTDILHAPWNELVADGLALPFRDGVADGVAGLDLVHHLARPGAFLTEAVRVLRPGGVLAVIEPWVTPLSFPIYRWLHQEGCRLGIDPWDPFPEAGGKEPFEGNAAVLWRLLRTTRAPSWERLGLAPPRVQLFNGFAYVLSLGFRPASLLPPALTPVVLRLDSVAAGLARLTGLRALAVWRKPPA